MSVRHAGCVRVSSAISTAWVTAQRIARLSADTPTGRLCERIVSISSRSCLLERLKERQPVHTSSSLVHRLLARNLGLWKPPFASPNGAQVTEFERIFAVRGRTQRSRCRRSWF